ncbi:MAG: siroheme synthase [Myxococcaceae bacterium]|nr:siroheme synthase [Myxococcaceae bacterium]
MSKVSYPVHLDLSGRLVLVVGAGRVATRKIERLVETPAEVRVVAPQASAPVRKLASLGKLTLLQRETRREDVAGCFMVIAATDQTEVNAAVADWGRAAGALVSRVDAPEQSHFTVPAFVRGAQVEATVSTYGEAPSASRRLKRELQAWVDQGPDRFAREVAAVRRALQGREDITARLRKLNDSGLYEACVAADEGRIRRLVDAALGDEGHAAGPVRALQVDVARAESGHTDSPGFGERT